MDPRDDESGRYRRLPFLILGLACVGLGMLGVAVPGLPTTPFLVVALWAFSRSSRRFHDWLYGHPRFGPALRAWQEHRVIPARVKATAIGGMSLSLVVMIFVARVSWPWLLVTAVVMIAGVAFILSRPSEPADDRAPE